MYKMVYLYDTDTRIEKSFSRGWFSFSWLSRYGQILSPFQKDFELHLTQLYIGKIIVHANQTTVKQNQAQQNFKASEM